MPSEGTPGSALGPAPESGGVTGAEGTRPEAVQSVGLAKVRELVLAAHPDVVAEMVGGDTFDALLASVEPARAAYARILQSVQSMQASTGAAAQSMAASAAAPTSVPAGAPGRQTYTITTGDLSPSAKIAEGLKRRRAPSGQS